MPECRTTAASKAHRTEIWRQDHGAHRRARTKLKGALIALMTINQGFLTRPRLGDSDMFVLELHCMAAWMAIRARAQLA